MQTVMQIMVFLIILLTAASFVSGQLPHVKCRVKHKKIGCFGRSLTGATLLFSDRLLGGPNNKGHEIDWYNWNDYIHSLACRCNEDAAQQGHPYFVLHYLGSCLGVDAFLSGAMKKDSACISNGFTQCVSSDNNECVGNDRSYYIYETGRDGGFGEWGNFSPCSQTCDVGIKIRTRNCTNPAPTGLGRNCSYAGPLRDTASCNLIFCRDINECASNPCRNGGTCIDQLNRYTCSCPGGYTGTHCEIDIDECASSPCLNGGACANRINHYTCGCPGGYTGTRCQTDINECSSSPCMNGGVCYDRINHYTCSCATGFTGVRCQIDINECASYPCLNGGTCYDHIGSYSCSCPGSFRGSRCQDVLETVASFSLCDITTTSVMASCPSSRLAVRCNFGSYRVVCLGSSGGYICRRRYNSTLQCCDFVCY